MDTIARFEALLAAGTDNGMLRLTLGQAYLKRGDADAAAAHLEEAVRHDPDYSAAWKLLGRAEMARGDAEAARTALESGIEVATRRGDKQTVREIQVFLKRLDRARDAATD